ncbi:MAG: hypothetical protein HQL96_07235 [Magnetococcales bacterium]|nr:hypothetical protein [Magnetococcales bacterium]
MSSQESSASHAQFRIQDPVQVFATFSAEEIARRQQTDPAFDAPLHQEAMELVQSRLRARPPAQENVA